MSKHLFSIIIPAYNYAHTLERAFNSVLTQKRDNTELLIINDGSSDNTVEVIERLKGTAPNEFRVIHQNNSGPAATRNKGIAESNGDFLIFLDADDELAENALEHLEQTIRQNPSIGMIIGAHISVQPDGQKKLRSREPLSQSKEHQFKQYLLEGKLPISPSATTFHRKVFARYQYPEHFRCVEDIPVFSYVLANFQCITLNKPIALIHKHNDSLRNNAALNLAVGMSLLDEIFSPQRLPKNLLAYRSQYEPIRSLSLFRTLYISGEYAQSLEYFIQAVNNSPSTLLRFSYLSKAVRAIFYLCSQKKSTL